MGKTGPGGPLNEFALGPQAPILAKGHAKNRQTSPASFFSLPLPFWLGAYCHIQGPPKSVDFGRKTGPGGPLIEFPLGAAGPILAEGHAKNRQTSPASFFSLPLPFWLGAYCHLQGPPKSVDFGRKTGRTAAQRVCLGATGPILAEGHAKTGKRRPPHFLARLSPFGLAPTVIYRAHPSLWTSAGKTRWWGSRCGGRARRDCRWRPRTPSRARRSRRRG